MKTKKDKLELWFLNKSCVQQAIRKARFLDVDTISFKDWPERLDVIGSANSLEKFIRVVEGVNDSTYSEVVDF